MKEIPIKDDLITSGGETKYVIDGRLRRVPPYDFTYKTWCKGRWRDRLLIDVFSSEFRDKERAYYEMAIQKGLVTLDGKVANLESVIRNGNLIQHTTHKHEPPVTSRPIKVIFDDGQIVAIDKPSGIPVHPTGRYRFNTIVQVLKIEYGLEVHPVNRLDRLTSGLMFLAKNAKAAEKMSAQIRGRSVQKEYIARVIGEFPAGEEVVCEEPMCTVEPRLALNMVRPVQEGGRDCKTVFSRISYDGETSIVKCKPLTGRTHQIRVHLQYLGYPIANDPIYSDERVWGPSLGMGGHDDSATIIQKLDLVGKTEVAQSYYTQHMNPEEQKLGEYILDEKCPKCATELYSDPGPNDLDLWLHAYKYSGQETETKAETEITADPENDSVSNLVSELDENQDPQEPLTKKRKAEAQSSWTFETEFPEWALAPHKQYMEIALKEAAKCEPTETAFCVGAVLVLGNKILETGFSRELPGNTHAEQCALEKYFSKNNTKDVPKGTVIYTTMEPCSERLSGNLPCTDRLLSTSVQTVFVGVMEPEDFVKKNVGKERLLEKGIHYIQIPGYEAEAIKLAKKGHKENSS